MSAGSEELERLLKVVSRTYEPLEEHRVARAAIRALFAEREAALKTAERALERAGFRKSCDIPACNCGDQWGHGGYASERLHEIGEATWEALGTERANGRTILDQVHLMALDMKEREAQVAALHAALVRTVDAERDASHPRHASHLEWSTAHAGAFSQAQHAIHDSATTAREYTARVRAEVRKEWSDFLKKHEATIAEYVPNPHKAVALIWFLSELSKPGGGA